METPPWVPETARFRLADGTNINVCYRVLLQKREFILRETRKH